MRNKFLIVALIAILLAGGMVLVSCENSACPGDGKCEIGLNNLFGTGNCYWTNDLGVYDCMPGSATKCKCK